jgi:excisionase family DNA binding protein
MNSCLDLREPVLLTVHEVGALLRTTPKAIYAMTDRRALPGVVRIGRRLLFRRADLLEWLRQKSNAIAKEKSDERDSQTVSTGRLGGRYHDPAAEWPTTSRPVQSASLL